MKIIVRTIHRNTHSFDTDNITSAREMATRIVTEGAWIVMDDREIFLPVHQIQKVVIRL